MRSARVRSAVVSIGLVFAIVAIAHQLTYALAHGDGPGFAAAMRTAGHDGYWSAFVVAVAAAVGLIAATGIAQVAVLWWRVTCLGPSVTVAIDADADPFGRLLVRRAIRLGILAMVIFVAQENLELVAAGQEPPMLAVLAHHGSIAVPLLATVALLVAAADSIVRWKRRLLGWRLAAAVSARPPARSPRRPIIPVLRIRLERHGRRNAGRSPPGILVQAI